MRRFAIPVVAVLLLAAACGGGKKQSALTGTGPSASPGVSASAAPGGSAAPGKSAGTTTGGASPAGGATAGKAAAPKTTAGFNLPKDGKYVYGLDGEATNPFTPGAPPQKFSNETLTKQVSHSGNVITTEQTSSVQPGKVTQKVRWEATRVVLLYVDASTPQGDFTCTFDPPLLLFHLPARAETIPTQQFKGQGNACSGKLDITVQRRETANDATGHQWSTWRAHVRTQTNAGGFTQSNDETRWVAPLLGAEIRTQGTYQVTGAGGTQTGHGSTTTALKSYPK